MHGSTPQAQPQLASRAITNPMVGRPPYQWTEQTESEIFNRLIDGESIVDICGIGRDDWLPSKVTFYARLVKDEEFANRYARAREAQAHNEVDEIRSIADEATPEDVAVARLRVDARKWRASKLAPKKYGDKLDVNHGGSFTVNITGDDADL